MFKDYYYVQSMLSSGKITSIQIYFSSFRAKIKANKVGKITRAKKIINYNYLTVIIGLNRVGIELHVIFRPKYNNINCIPNSILQ